MTAPKNGGLEEELRQALSAAADQVEPGDTGLDQILSRTSGTTPQPWLLSMAVEVARRVRHWAWRGHWAWQDPRYWSGSPLARHLATSRRLSQRWLRRCWAAWDHVRPQV